MTTRVNLIVAAAGIVVFFLLISLAQEVNRQWQATREIERLATQVRQQEAVIVELEHLNQYFRTDDFQERLAREKLNYRAPGEQVVLISDKELDDITATASAPEQENIVAAPLQWWNVFFEVK